MRENIAKNLCKVIALANQKGGVAKSFTTASLAVGLVNSGNRVLVIDNDPQGHASRCLGVRKPEKTIYDIMEKLVKGEEFTRDRDISLKAKGLYLVIQANITMPDKRWRKEDFKSMTCEGKKAFDGAWNELKEAGYLKVHMYSNGVTWTVEYELLDEPAAGAHTFYYNSKGELTKTNLERAVAKSINVGSDVENDEENPEKEENFRIPPFGSNGNGSNGNRYNGNGYNGNGYNGDGSNGNGGNNNKDLITNPNIKDSDINTSIKSYPQTSKEAPESQNMIDGLIESNNHYMEVIKENIKYDELMRWFDPEVRQRYDELYQIICDVVCVPRSTIRVNGKDYPYELVKSQFLKLKKEHVEYVANSMKTNLGEVKNIRSYLITALYNAPSTYCNYVAQAYRTVNQTEYESEYDVENKREIEYMKSLRESDPEGYKVYIHRCI